MELQKGMYVRINNDIRKICIGIGRIKQINQDTIYVEMDNKLPISFSKSEISKSSPNIIDLIEVGDYVNGRYVDKYQGKSGNFCELPNGKWEFVEISNKHYLISSIVTKEQFSSMEYNIGDE